MPIIAPSGLKSASASEMSETKTTFRPLTVIEITNNNAIIALYNATENPAYAACEVIYSGINAEIATFSMNEFPKKEVTRKVRYAIKKTPAAFRIREPYPDGIPSMFKTEIKSIQRKSVAPSDGSPPEKYEITPFSASISE